MTSVERRREKASCVVRAWQRLYGTVPTRHAVVAVCSVGEHETLCGDAWSHSGNWGAIQRRGMTSEEKAVVRSGGTPSPQDPFELLTRDSSPITGVYQAWYWRFPQGVVYPGCGLAGDDAGAWKLLRVLLDGRPAIKAAIDSISPDQMAERMYASRYFEGVHDPRKPGGKEANVADYARALRGTSAAFERDLATWDPASVAPAEEPVDLGDVEFWRDVETLNMQTLLDSIREGVEECGPSDER